jgi:hypothetical protein
MAAGSAGRPVGARGGKVRDMAGTWTSERFPQFEPAIRRLTEQHRELKDEPLHLALAYLPLRQGREVTEGVFLFEVIGGAAESLADGEDLFETTFEAAPGLPTGFDQTLHLILTTPGELEKALAEGWPVAEEITDAVRRGNFKVLHSDGVGERVLRKIKGVVHRSKRAARG